jgi:mannose-1-phosphate guanylyltransferase
MSIQNNYVAILAGGIGSRFWPESRQHLPKQFLDLFGTGRSLLQTTFHRFEHICPVENIFVITHENYVDLVKEHLPELPTQNILGEPSRKNTASSAAYIAHKLYALNPEANILISPADHLILDQHAFERQVFEAMDFVAHNEVLATLGIKPTRPDTGYGYIQYQKDGNDKEDGNFYKVKTFTEKPNLELARTFLKSGDFLWNSGIFIWNVKTILNAFKEYLPELHEVFIQAKEAFNTEDERAEIEMVYTQCTNISIDYGIMEKAQNVYVLPSHFGWSDLGTWESAYEHSEKDYLGNVVSGNDVMIVDASECMIKVPKDKLVVVQGLEQFIIVDTKDILLICERNKEQEIKAYVSEIKRNKGEKYL